MRSPQPLAVVALARRFDLPPACAKLLMSLFGLRHCRSEKQLGRAAGISSGSIRVYVSNIRAELGNGAIITDWNEGYLLSDDARAAVKAALAQMYAEIAEYLKPHLADAA